MKGQTIDWLRQMLSKAQESVIEAQKRVDRLLEMIEEAKERIEVKKIKEVV